MPRSNDLYLAVLPIVHITPTDFLGFGLTEETLTLFPDKNFATEFFPDEVETYISTFEARANRYLKGGHVKSYEFHREPTENGRVIVRVVQNVE